MKCDKCEREINTCGECGATICDDCGEWTEDGFFCEKCEKYDEKGNITLLHNHDEKPAEQRNKVLNNTPSTTKGDAKLPNGSRLAIPKRKPERIDKSHKNRPTRGI